MENEMTPEQHEQLLQAQFNDLDFYGQSVKKNNR